MKSILLAAALVCLAGTARADDRTLLRMLGQEAHNRCAAEIARDEALANLPATWEERLGLDGLRTAERDAGRARLEAARDWCRRLDAAMSGGNHE